MKCVPLKVYMLRCVPTAPSLHMLKLRSALNFDRTSYEFSFKTQSNLWETFFGGGERGGNVHRIFMFQSKCGIQSHLPVACVFVLVPFFFVSPNPNVVCDGTAEQTYAGT